MPIESKTTLKTMLTKPGTTLVISNPLPFKLDFSDLILIFINSSFF